MEATTTSKHSPKVFDKLLGTEYREAMIHRLYAELTMLTKKKVNPQRSRRIATVRRTLVWWVCVIAVTTFEP